MDHGWQPGWSSRVRGVLYISLDELSTRNHGWVFGLDTIARDAGVPAAPPRFAAAEEAPGETPPLPASSTTTQQRQERVCRRIETAATSGHLGCDDVEYGRTGR